MTEWSPYRMTTEEILRERERFSRARALVAEGKIEDARRICWWPRSEELPREHWSEKRVRPCSCGKKSPEGSLALCRYCNGATPETPEILTSN